jgi:hypothetical protein
VDIQNKFFRQPNKISWFIFTQDIKLAWTKIRRRKFRKNKNKRKKKKQTVCTCYKWFLFSDATTRFTHWHPQLRPSIGCLATVFVLQPAGSRICISCYVPPNHLTDGPPSLTCISGFVSVRFQQVVMSSDHTMCPIHFNVQISGTSGITPGSFYYCNHSYIIHHCY